MKLFGRRFKTRRNHLHYQFLCASLTNCRTKSLPAYLEDPLWDWERLVKMASEELVLPLLYNRLESYRESLPAEIVEVLKNARNFNFERNQLILDELKHVARLANELDVQPIALKGSAHLLRDFYASVSDRYLVDIDLLIPEQKIDLLFDHLRANGYSPDPGNPVGVDCHHQVALSRRGGPPIELHRSVGMGRPKDLLPASEVIRNSVPWNNPEVGLRTPSDEHILIHQVLHAQLSDSYRSAIWPQLREAFDCWLLITKLSSTGQLATIHLTLRSNSVLRLIKLHLFTILETLRPVKVPSEFASLRPPQFAWAHRRILLAVPMLRFLDPYYLLRSAFLPRVYRLKDLTKSREGIAYVIKAPFRGSFYRSLWSEML